jgi:signal transduction histidine kinase
LLAKIENQQFLDQEQINLPVLLEKLVAQFSEQLEQKHISVEMEQFKTFTIKANGTMIEVLFTNLLTNAIRYSPSNSSIKVLLKDGVFSILNKGEPLRNSDKIFDRFQRDVGNSHGSGIGLAIVKRICDNNGYSIQYQYQQGTHVFSIKF